VVELTGSLSASRITLLSGATLDVTSGYTLSSYALGKGIVVLGMKLAGFVAATNVRPPMMKGRRPPMIEPRPAIDPFGGANRYYPKPDTYGRPIPCGFKPGTKVTPLRGRRMAKRGRPTAATSWQRNPNHIAAQHAKVLMETWLAEAPVLEIRVMLSSLAGNPEAQALIEECWSKLGNDRAAALHVRQQILAIRKQRFRGF
jgi:hypothetical protein